MGAADFYGLFDQPNHENITVEAFAKEGFGADIQNWAAPGVSGVDKFPGSQNADPEHSPWHAMCAQGQSPAQVAAIIQAMIDYAINNCDWNMLLRALHAVQDGSARGHRGCQVWNGHVTVEHIKGDMKPSPEEYAEAVAKSRAVIAKFKEKCTCIK